MLRLAKRTIEILHRMYDSLIPDEEYTRKTVDYYLKMSGIPLDQKK